MKSTALVVPLLVLPVFASFLSGDGSLGYSDTPLLPGGQWHVHDGARPQPRRVDVGADGVPSDAIVLFNGSDLSEWASGDGPARWKVADGAMEVNGTGGISTRRSFGDVQLHIEWASPSTPASSSQGRGNSGVFFYGLYEVQILDSFENPTYPDGQAAALYGQYPPLVNATRPPGEWQTYDIIFRAPRFDGETLTAPARATVLHNGVLVQDAQELIGQTAHKKVAGYAPHAAKAPLSLQDHGNPVRFRNVWIRELE